MYNVDCDQLFCRSCSGCLLEHLHGQMVTLRTVRKTKAHKHEQYEFACFVSIFKMEKNFYLLVLIHLNNFLADHFKHYRLHKRMNEISKTIWGKAYRENNHGDQIQLCYIFLY